MITATARPANAILHPSLDPRSERLLQTDVRSRTLSAVTAEEYPKWLINRMLLVEAQKLKTEVRQRLSKPATSVFPHGLMVIVIEQRCLGLSVLRVQTGKLDHQGLLRLLGQQTHEFASHAVTLLCYPLVMN